MPVGPNCARTLPGSGPAAYTAPSGVNIVCFYFANIGSAPIAVLFLSDGSIVQVNTNTSVATTMAGAGTMTEVAIPAIGISQWGSLFVIIVGKQGGSGNGYFLWDGTTFYTAGMSVPGFGTLPSGLRGNAVETYQGRVWVANGASITFSAPGSITDFSTGDGGGSFTSTDSFLRVGFTQPRQTNGFLYLIADSSVNYVSGVQTAGTPPTTTFTNQNADPEIGTPYAASMQVFSRNIVFANAFGCHVSYGGAVTKISDQLNGVYNTVANFGGFVPSSAKAILYGQRVWMVLIPVIDPITSQQVNKLFMWNGKVWWSSQQDVNLTFVECQEINSVLSAWGTDGNSLYPLFQNPSVGFTKTIQSRLFSTPGGYMLMKSLTRFWGVAYYYDIVSPDLTVSLDSERGSTSVTVVPTSIVADWTNASDAAVTWTNASSATVTWLNTGSAIASQVAVLPVFAQSQTGQLLGLTISTDCADVALVSTAFAGEDWGYQG